MVVKKRITVGSAKIKRFCGAFWIIYLGGQDDAGACGKRAWRKRRVRKKEEQARWWWRK